MLDCLIFQLEIKIITKMYYFTKDKKREEKFKSAFSFIFENVIYLDTTKVLLYLILNNYLSNSFAFSTRLSHLALKSFSSTG